MSMNMPQNTAPESYYSDQTEVRPKSKDGKQTPPFKVSHYESNKKVSFGLVKWESTKDNYFDIIAAAFIKFNFPTSSFFRLRLNVIKAEKLLELLIGICVQALGCFNQSHGSHKSDCI